MNFCVDLGLLKPFLFLSSCLVVGTALVGCGGGVDVPVAKLAPDKPAPTKTVDPATAGSVTGRVTLTGKPEPMRPIDMNSEPSCASAHPSPVIPPAVVIDASGHLANAVVYIKSGVSDYLFHPPAAPAQLTQKGCMYEPHVTAVMAGETSKWKTRIGRPTTFFLWLSRTVHRTAPPSLARSLSLKLLQSRSWRFQSSAMFTRG